MINLNISKNKSKAIILSVLILFSGFIIYENSRVEKIREDSYQEGYDEGEEEGYKKGYAEGYNQGVNESAYSGQQLGYSKGYNDAQINTISCIHCDGRGVNACSFCDGVGCFSCSNTGLRKCSICNGRGWNQY